MLSLGAKGLVKEPSLPLQVVGDLELVLLPLDFAVLTLFLELSEVLDVRAVDSPWDDGGGITSLASSRPPEPKTRLIEKEKLMDAHLLLLLRLAHF